MSLSAFDLALDLYWPALLPPLQRNGPQIIVYFGRRPSEDGESWVLVAEAVTHTAPSTVHAHGARARVVGTSKSVLGVVLVYATSTTPTAAPGDSSMVDCQLPSHFWPFLAFGSPLHGMGSGVPRPALKIADLVVERQADMLHAPVVIRFKVDCTASHLRAVFAAGARGVVVAAGVLEDFRDGMLSVRVESLTYSGVFARPIAGTGRLRALSRVTLTVWQRFAAFFKWHTRKIEGFRGAERETMPLILLREFSSPLPSPVPSVVLTLSMPVVPK